MAELEMDRECEELGGCGSSRVGSDGMDGIRRGERAAGVAYVWSAKWRESQHSVAIGVYDHLASFELQSCDTDPNRGVGRWHCGVIKSTVPATTDGSLVVRPSRSITDVVREFQLVLRVLCLVYIGRLALVLIR